MKKYLSIIFCVVLLFLSACLTTEELIQSNGDVIKAQHIQTIYFEIVDNPAYLTNYPTGWSIYTNEEIERAKELYLERQ